MKLADYLLQNPIYGQGQATLREGTQTTPVASWQQGLARALQGGLGGLTSGYGLGKAQEEQSADNKALGEFMQTYGKDPQGARAILAARPNLGEFAAQVGMQDVALQKQLDLARGMQQLNREGQQADMQMWGMAPSGGGNAGPYGNAIAGIESAGQPNGGYGAVGPVANQQGNRAYGKYQVLDSNIGPWTKEVLGQEMTPQQFLASPQAQDAVFKAKFGQYVQQTGSPEAAARAWFAGPGGMNNSNARDVNGMTVAQYSNRFSAASGQPNVPQQGDTVTVQGVPIPRAALFGALQIQDPKERQKALAGVMQEAVKRQAEGVPLERVRQPDGSEAIVPRAQAGGMVSAQNVPPPGSTEGDVDLLTRALQDPNLRTPDVRAAYDRLAQPQMSQNGQLKYPDMSAWAPLGFNAPTGVQFRDTPSSQFQMSGKLADDYGANKTVKDFKEVTPILQSMKEAAGRNDRVADLNLIYGLAKIMDPGSVVREGEMTMVKNTQSLPDWVRTALTSAINGTSNFTPEQRQRIIREAESRTGALRQQYDTITQQYNDKAGRYGLNPQDVTGGIAQPQQHAPAQNVPVYDLNGKRLK